MESATTTVLSVKTHRCATAHSGSSRSRLARVRGLPALVEIAIAAADVARPDRPTRSFSSSSDAYKTGDRRPPAFDATVHFALGQFRLSEPRVTSLKGFGAPMEVERTPLVAPAGC